MVAATPSTPSMLYLIKQLELAVRSRLDAVLKPSGVTSLQYTALTLLERRSNMSSAQLARNSFVTAQSMSDLVGTLYRRGLVTKTEDPAHRRRLLMSLTDAGRALLDANRERVDELEQMMVDGLGKRDVSELRRFLVHCHQRLSDLD